MKPLFVQYPKCGTCQKAAKWLKNNGVDVETRDIVTQNPTKDELRRWIATSGKHTAKFFNTSGLKYKELKLKDVVKTAADAELLTLLASDGMLVKRPILITETFVLSGFNEQEWAEKLK